jgi:hypothetical protein
MTSCTMRLMMGRLQSEWPWPWIIRKRSCSRHQPTLHRRAISNRRDPNSSKSHAESKTGKSPKTLPRLHYPCLVMSRQATSHRVSSSLVLSCLVMPFRDLSMPRYQTPEHATVAGTANQECAWSRSGSSGTRMRIRYWTLLPGSAPNSAEACRDQADRRRYDR